MAGIPVIAQITRQGGANFPIAVAEDIKGAFITVADTTARDAIPTNILRTGAICRIANTSTYYEWNGSAWISFSFGSGATVIDWKDSVRFATTTALAASTRVSNTRTANANGAFPTVDGVTAAVGNRFLDKDNATGADRGIWEITSLGSGGAPWVINRASDADTSGEVTSGMGCTVAEGTANGGKIFLLTTADPITLNTTALTFAALSGGVTAGNGLTGTSTLSVLAANSTITVGPSGIKRTAITGDVVIPDASETATIQADVVTNAHLAGSIAWEKLLTAIGNLGFTGLKSIAYNGEVDNATTTLDFTTGALQKKTLAANTTLATPTAPPAFTPVQMRFIQASSGGPYTLTFWGSIVWSGTAPTMPTAASAELIVSGYHDGATWRLAGKTTVGNGVEYASDNTTIQVSSQLPARGQENVVIDLYPSTQTQGTLATAASVNIDYALSTGKVYEITARVSVNDGAGGSILYKKTLLIGADNVGGTAAVLTTDFSGDMATSGWTFTAAGSGANIRFTLGNTSGSTRSYNVIIGAVITDKP